MEYEVVEKEEIKEEKPKNYKKLILIVVGIFIVLASGSFIAWSFYQKNKVVTIITMDINPSITISLNKDDEVIKVESLNEYGKALLDNKKFKDKSLEDTLDDISSLLIEKEYIKEEDNTILINVEGKNIENKVKNIVKETFEENKVECNVIVQETSETASLKAKEYGISSSKASYIEKIVKDNPEYDFNELKDKTISELNEIVNPVVEEPKEEEPIEKEPVEEPKLETNNSETPRYGSDVYCENKNEMDRDAALNKALSYNGITPSEDTRGAQLTTGKYNGICTYRMVLDYNQKRYVTHINVETGALVHTESETYLAGAYMDALKYVHDYFASKYGATQEEVFIDGGGSGGFDDPIMQMRAVYKEVNYRIDIDKKSAVIKSVTVR